METNLYIYGSMCGCSGMFGADGETFRINSIENAAFAEYEGLIAVFNQLKNESFVLQMISNSVAANQILGNYKINNDHLLQKAKLLSTIVKNHNLKVTLALSNFYQWRQTRNLIKLNDLPVSV